MNRYLVKSAFILGLGARLVGVAGGIGVAGAHAAHGVAHVAINNMTRPKNLGDPARVAPIVEPQTKMAQEAADNKYLTRIERSQSYHKEMKSGRFTHGGHRSKAKE